MIFFTSDQHIGHSNIIQFCNRPFNSLDHMHAVISQNWINVVADDDYVFMLGDIALGKPVHTLEFYKNLPGKKILIPGNHDNSVFKKYVKPSGLYGSKYYLYEQNNIEVFHDLSYFLELENFVLKLSHFPYKTTSYNNNKYLSFYNELIDTHVCSSGVVKPMRLLHGHVHDSYKISRHPNPKFRSINVGVDVWNFTPVSLEEISYLVETELF